MSHAIEILKAKYKLPFNRVINSKTGERFTSVLVIMQEVCSYEMTEQQYLTAIGELIQAPDKLTSWDDKRMPRIVFQYLVQNFVNDYKAGRSQSVEDVYLNSIIQARDYIAKNSWVFATGEDPDAPPKLDANGNIQPKKGDKKILAKKVYDEHKSKGMSRKEWIALLVKEVGLTEAGASTYYSNLKNGTY